MARTTCGAGFLYASTVYAYNEDYIPAETPATMADFFDLEKFPGRRGMRRVPQGNLEFALMADGVPRDLPDSHGSALQRRLHGFPGSDFDRPGDSGVAIERGPVGQGGAFAPRWPAGVSRWDRRQVCGHGLRPHPRISRYPLAGGASASTRPPRVKNNTVPSGLLPTLTRPS